MEPKIQKSHFLVIGLILLAALSRIIPHPHNFTPFGGIAVLGSFYLGRKMIAFVIPLVALWISDLFINNVIYPVQFPEYYSGFQFFGSIWVYGSFLLMIPMGWFMLSKITVFRLILTGFSTATMFFLITNFGSWINNPFYPQDFNGLMLSYIAGLPFYQNTLLGDLFYIGVLFGSTKLLFQKYPNLSIVER